MTHHDSTLCNWAKIKHSVPQHSIVGLLLFLLYMNDLSKFTNNKSEAFCLLMIQVYSLLTHTLSNLMQILIQSLKL